MVALDKLIVQNNASDIWQGKISLTIILTVLIFTTDLLLLMTLVRAE